MWSKFGIALFAPAGNMAGLVTVGLMDDFGVLPGFAVGVAVEDGSTVG